jgi:Holliday junction resolvase RusA-like endonuclease
MDVTSQDVPQETIAFMVLGEPTPEGSTRAFYIKKLERTVTTHQNKRGLQAWRNRVATEAQRALEGREWTSDGVSAYSITVDFVMSRPNSVPEHRRIRPTVKPDIDKLIRAVADALTGILFLDDCQVTSMVVNKGYNDARRTGAYIVVSRYGNQSTCPRSRKGKTKARAVVTDEEPSEDPRDD